MNKGPDGPIVVRGESSKLGIVGLGYVGLPLAVAFAETGEQLIGFDLDREKVEA